MQFYHRSSDPDLILAERPFGGHHPERVDVPLRLAMGLIGLVNLPAIMAAMLTAHAFEGPLGLLRASWIGTGVFFVVVALQWWAIGLLIAALRSCIRPPTLPAKSTLRSRPGP